MTGPVRAAAVQMQHLSGDKRANLTTMRRFVERAAHQQVQIIVFPECCITGYWFLRRLSRGEILALAEPVPDGASLKLLREWSAEHRLTIGVGLIERDERGRLFNAYMVAMPDGRWACHRKIHAFVSEHLSCGQSYTVFDTPHGCRAGVLTCYDNNLVENARLTALAGAELLLAPHQTGGCASRSPHAMKPIDPQLWARREEDPDALAAAFRGDSGRAWIMRWLPSRAHDNGMFLIFANGVGPDDEEVRTGNAMILDPYGRVLVESSSLGDDMVVADLDPRLRDECTGVRWLRARRPELYQPLAQRRGDEQDTRSVRFGPAGGDSP